MPNNERRVQHQGDAAGVGPYAQETGRLVPLRELDDWGVVDGEPDIRGWEVRTVSGRDLGEVKDLLVDPEAREVVMLDVDLRGSDQHALVPIRVVAIDRHARVVRVDSGDLTPVDRAGAAVAAAGTSAQPVADRPRREPARVRYGAAPPTGEEVVVERRPVVMEEVVVRRRVVDPAEHHADAASAETPANTERDRVAREELHRGDDVL